MQYEKPWLPIEAQVDRLLERGLDGSPERMARALTHVSYYRLTGYLYPFRRADDTFVPGTHFDAVWDRYVFDRQLRLLFMDAIERIEVAVRRSLVDVIAREHGAFPDIDERTFPELRADQLRKLAQTLSNDYYRSREEFIEHFRRIYGAEHALPPMWMLGEVASLGTVLTMVQGLSRKQRGSIAYQFGVREPVLLNWLRVLNDLRNICAHHGRLWNRVLPKQIVVPRGFVSWSALPNQRLVAALILLRHCLNACAPTSLWHRRVEALLDDHPDIPRTSMGFDGALSALSAWSLNPR